MKIIITLSYQFYSESVWFLKPFCHCASPPHFWIFLSFLWCHFSTCNYTTIIRKPGSNINKCPYLKNKSLKVWGGNPLTNCHHIIKYHINGYHLHYIVHYLCMIHVNLVCSKYPTHLDRSFSNPVHLCILNLTLMLTAILIYIKPVAPYSKSSTTETKPIFLAYLKKLTPSYFHTKAISIVIEICLHLSILH